MSPGEQSAAGEEGDEQSQFIVDGRPDGFRPGVGIASATSSGAGDGSRSSVSTTSIGAGGVAGMAVIVASAVAAILAAAFLIARKRRRQQELEQQLQAGNGGISDKAKLIYLNDPSSSGGVAAGGKSVPASDIAAGAGAGVATGAAAGETANDSFESDVNNILADIESFGGERLASLAGAAAVGAAVAGANVPQFNPSSWSGDDGAIELDPEAAAAYLAGASATRSTDTARSRSTVSTTSKSTSAAVIASASDSTTTSNSSPEDRSILPTDSDMVDGDNGGSFVSANVKDIGRRHSAHDVCVCKSSTCVGCQDLNLNVGNVDFVSASKIRTYEKSSVRGMLSKLVAKSDS